MRIFAVLPLYAGIALTAPISHYANDVPLAEHGLTEHVLDTNISPEADNTVGAVVEAVRRDSRHDELRGDYEPPAVRINVTYH